MHRALRTSNSYSNGGPGVTLLLLLGLKRCFTSIRISEMDEDMGLDITEHGEVAYHVRPPLHKPR